MTTTSFGSGLVGYPKGSPPLCGELFSFLELLISLSFIVAPPSLYHPPPIDEWPYRGMPNFPASIGKRPEGGQIGQEKDRDYEVI